VYIYSWKKIDTSLIHFGDALCKSRIFLHVKCLHVVVQLYNGVTSPWMFVIVGDDHKCEITRLWIILVTFTDGEDHTFLLEFVYTIGSGVLWTNIIEIWSGGNRNYWWLWGILQGVNVFNSASIAHLLSTLTDTHDLGCLGVTLFGSQPRPSPTSVATIWTYWWYSRGRCFMVIHVGSWSPEGLTSSNVGTQGWKKTQVPNHCGKEFALAHVWFSLDYHTRGRRNCAQLHDWM
jgi:hypothetical protein